MPIQNSEENQPSIEGSLQNVYANLIDTTDLKRHLYTYASDEFEGRDTGSEGQKKAVKYLASWYQQMNLKPAQSNGDYFQQVPLSYNVPPEGKLIINQKVYENGTNILAFNPIKLNANNIFYANYGIMTERYQDYLPSQVEGKIVLIKNGEPIDENGYYKVSGKLTPSDWGSTYSGLELKFNALKEAGAKAVLFYAPSDFSRIKQNFLFMKKNTNRMQLDISDKQEEAPLIFLDEIFWQQLISNSINESQDLTVDVKIDLTVSQKLTSENVIAVIEGKTKPEEYVIISSHLDHIGITDGLINNGADDDGSGTVAMLEIAQAFKAAENAGQGPERTIVFLHVTGEEKGLFGSQYYTDYNPIFPLDQTVVNLNIDMIGRTDPDRVGSDHYVYLIGSDKLSTELHELSESVNKNTLNFELDYKFNKENDPNRFYYRSDHYNFAKNNIPVIFYFNGTHEDYHQPTDTPDKIRYDLLCKRAQLIFYTAWELANRPDRIKVDTK